MRLNQEEFESCLSSTKHIDEIRNDLDDGRNYGVSGTPGFFVGNDRVGFVELKGAKIDGLGLMSEGIIILYNLNLS